MHWRRTRMYPGSIQIQDGLWQNGYFFKHSRTFTYYYHICIYSLMARCQFRKYDVVLPESSFLLPLGYHQLDPPSSSSMKYTLLASSRLEVTSYHVLCTWGAEERISSGLSALLYCYYSVCNYIDLPMPVDLQSRPLLIPKDVFFALSHTIYSIDSIVKSCLHCWSVCREFRFSWQMHLRDQGISAPPRSFSVSSGSAFPELELSDFTTRFLLRIWWISNARHLGEISGVLLENELYFFPPMASLILALRNCIIAILFIDRGISYSSLPFWECSFVNIVNKLFPPSFLRVFPQILDLSGGDALEHLPSPIETVFFGGGSRVCENMVPRVWGACSFQNPNSSPAVTPVVGFDWTHSAT